MWKKKVFYAFILVIAALIIGHLEFPLSPKNKTSQEVQVYPTWGWTPTIEQPKTNANDTPVCDTLETYAINNPKEQWLTLSSSLLGLSFEVLSPKGEIAFNYLDCKDRTTDPTGSSFVWHINTDSTKQDVFGEGGAISANFSAGREVTVTDFHQLNSSYYSNAIKTYKTKYNTDAVLLKSNIRYGEYAEILYPGFILAADLPYKSKAPFKGLLLYFPNGISEESIQRVVNSITLR